VTAVAADPVEPELRPGLRYAPGLDGLRALAVVAVFAYHAGVAGVGGGFLGVDVFFVLSGYLVTSLVLTEHEATGAVALGRFWARRARRLLPAVVALLAVVTLAVPLLAPDAAGRLRGDVAAALGYVSNWRLVFGDVSYFEAVGRPPVLQHLWSLAVEEQFYLLWPPLLGGALALAAGSGVRRRLGPPLLVAAAASYALMALLYEPGATSRAYFGTDTRFGALALGAALACFAPGLQAPETWSPGRRGRLGLAGVGALVALVGAMSAFGELDAALYRGGFALVAVLAAIVVAAAAQPGRQGLGLVLGASPLVWLGKRSYGIYLWYWPVLVLTRPGTDVAIDGAALLALRAALTVGLAAASYRFVELPWRTGAGARRLGELGEALRYRRPPGRPALAMALLPVVATAMIGTGVVASARAAGSDGGGAATVAAALARARTELAAIQGDATPAAPQAAPAAEGGADPTPASSLPVEPTTPPPPETSPSTTNPPATVPALTPAPTGTLPALVPGPGQPPPVAVGESVLLGAAPALARLGFTVDAAVARQTSEVVTIAQGLAAEGRIGPVMLVHTGHNGPISAEQVEAILAAFGTARTVVVVGVKVDRPWEGPNNQLLAEAAARWPNAVFVDWRAVSAGQPGLFYADGLHLRPEGVEAFVAAVAAAIPPAG